MLPRDRSPASTAATTSSACAGYLQSCAVVRRITPVRATPQGLEVELELVTGMPGLQPHAREDGWSSAEGGEGDPPVSTSCVEVTT